MMKKNTILWADDDMDDLQMMREILLKNEQNFHIVEVGNGREALYFLEQALHHDKLPCLIILDINMPVLGGKETLTTIKNREEFKSIPVVVFTTSESDLDRMFCEKYNTQMITKPPSYKSLEATIFNVLGYAKSLNC
ncbi:MAG: response regulator [Flavisolibacter sp.]